MYLFVLLFCFIIIFCLTAIETRWRFSCCVSSMSCSKFTNMAAVNSCAILPRSVTRCRMAAVSPCTVLTPPIGLSEPVLHWLQSDVVALGLRCAKKVRVAVRRRQALRCERRLERSVMETTVASSPSGRRTGTVSVSDVSGLSSRPSRPPEELRLCRSFLPPPLSPAAADGAAGASQDGERISKVHVEGPCASKPLQKPPQFHENTSEPVFVAETFGQRAFCPQVLLPP